MLAIDFLEALGRRLVILRAQRIERAVVQDLDGLLDIVLVVVVTTAAGQRDRRDAEREPGGSAAKPVGNLNRHTVPSTLCTGAVISCRLEKKRGREGPC